MQKFVVFATSALTQGIDAYRMSSMNTPFSGEHANSQIIEFENRSTHLSTPVVDSINKYDAILSKVNKEPYKSPETRLYEKIFGVAEEAPERNTRKRLGAQQAIVSNQKKDLFTAAFYMGGFDPM